MNVTPDPVGKLVKAIKAEREPREIRYCSHVVDNDCMAPAGFRVGGGVAKGTRGCRGTCFRCGEPVCSNCSELRVVQPYGRQRVGRGCEG